MPKNGLVTLLLIAMGVALLWAYRPAPLEQPEKVSITTVIEEIQRGQVKEVRVKGDEAEILLVNEKKQTTAVSGSTELLLKIIVEYNTANDPNVSYIEEKPDQAMAILGNILLSLLPVLLIGGFFIYMMRQAQGQNNQAMGFGKSTAKRFIGNRQNVTFGDVAGCDEAVEEAKEIVDFLKYPEKLSAVGARIPKGILLVGPPGTGKTLLARAVAGEAGVPFFSISGSEFVQMFVGVGASRVRDLFDQAKRNAPCIIFIDEIDAVGRQRGAGLGGSHDEREQTLNQILVEMDGFEQGTNVIVMASTNRPDVLDPALIRPGRFDRQLVLDRPDIRGRLAILQVHVRGKPFEKEVLEGKSNGIGIGRIKIGNGKKIESGLFKIAKRSAGLTGADLANVVNEAAILAGRKGKKQIGTEELEAAFDKVALGPARTSRRMSPEEKEIVAYHEAGHALVAHALYPLCDKVDKITVIPRGMALGATWTPPAEDSYLTRKKKLEADIAKALGGWVVEQIHLGGDMTTGASNDIEKASEMARAMVTRYGMSEKLGPLAYGRRDELIFLGRQIQEEKNFSDATAEQIDAEVREIVKNAEKEARRILEEAKRDGTLDRVVKKLLEVETLDAEEFEALVSGTSSSSA
ncbi:hypothetical protein A2797_01615 [candidate division WWE3 bacterium RIFCSPHIGHO2_01_FULL_48_15]|uniref:ATP-dependent zinc metalloprotease FtsH n=1 Tax=candidate division WWE3 bacterium RIFCSPHIGHO2_01_FULL_48_15 TaxID=1802619 RepID=A0A1F4VBS4_UNCKA|nr:MAG: hypothetical protein A2797_01615 [candidate division WWE3 bacterium RIFCSPHIGHO2_01_FULL_48_15]